MTGAVAVLFARSDSNYKSMPTADVWDAERDARRWPGGAPVVAHPPCRAWGRLRHFAKPRPDEKALALFAVEQVRAWGGVLEHPAHSTLWAAAGMPKPGHRDDFGGWTLPIRQCDWGHKAEKKTWLYIVGIGPDDLPEMPPPGEPTGVVKPQRGVPRTLKIITKAEREHTPPQLAAWLVDLAKRCAK